MLDINQQIFEIIVPFHRDVRDLLRCRIPQASINKQKLMSAGSDGKGEQFCEGIFKEHLLARRGKNIPKTM